MAVKKVKAAPAAKTPLRSVSQESGSPLKIPLYRVWYALRTDPASKHAAATRKVNLQMGSNRLVDENFLGNCNWNDLVDTSWAQILTAKSPDLELENLNETSREAGDGGDTGDGLPAVGSFQGGDGDYGGNIEEEEELKAAEKKEQQYQFNKSYSYYSITQHQFCAKISFSQEILYTQLITDLRYLHNSASP
uniref:Uncharacterized protein n=1 Tax=Aegilops tauschii TaxID=37682 RepID=M8C446_AEGTA